MKMPSPRKLVTIQTISSSPKVLSRRLRRIVAFSTLVATKVKEPADASRA